MIFSVLIKNIRKEKNISQAEMAKLLNVTQQAVAKYEAGLTMRPSPALALRIEQATGGQVSRDELLFPELYQSQSTQDGSDQDKAA